MNNCLTLAQSNVVMDRIIGVIDSSIDAYMRTTNVPNDWWNNDIRKDLNTLIGSDNIQCYAIMVTNNIDKEIFGTYVSPSISDHDISKIINDCDSDVRFSEFKLEVDTKLFSCQYTAKEILALILNDIYGVMSPNSALKLRIAIDACICNTGRGAAGYIIKPIEKIYEYKVFRYAMISFLRNLYTFAGDNQYFLTYPDGHILNTYGLNEIIRSIYKDRVTAIGGGTNPDPELSVFRWVFNLIDDLDIHVISAIDTLFTIKQMTGSKIEAELVSMAIEALKTIGGSNPNQRYVKESSILEGFSLFKSLKTNGLRGIEDDLYEYKIRIKNCEDEEDAMYILRQINTRLTILDDYLRNTDKLSDNERARWQGDIEEYKNLRFQLGQKKIGSKKQYGIFIDYDKLDQL